MYEMKPTLSNAKLMVMIYNESIDNWIDDHPLTYTQTMWLKHSGENLEATLKSDLERLAHWQAVLESFGE